MHRLIILFVIVQVLHLNIPPAVAAIVGASIGTYDCASAVSSDGDKDCHKKIVPMPVLLLVLNMAPTLCSVLETRLAMKILCRYWCPCWCS